MDINEIREYKQQVENAIADFATSKILAFQEETKITVTGISFDMIESSTIGQPNRINLASIKLKLDLFP